MSAPPERRRWPRVQLDLHVDMRFETAGDVANARSIDVSRGGVFLRSSRAKPVGTPVRLTLWLADTGQRIEVEGYVARVVPDPDDPAAPEVPESQRGMGIFLTGAPPEWEALCARLEATQAEAGE